MAAPEETEMEPVGVHPVTGRVLETEEAKVTGLRQVRRRMAASLASGEVARYPRDDDKFLLAFLRARKYNIEKAHMVLNNFAKFWYSHADLIDGLDVARTRPFLSLGMVRMLSGRDKCGNALNALYAGNIDHTRFTPRDQLAAGILFFAAFLDDDESQLQGCTYVETFSGFSLRAAMSTQLAMSSAEQKELMSMFTDTMPLRVRDIWVMHQPWYFTMFWNMVRPFLKKKLTKRVHMLGNNLERMYEAIDPAVLPPDVGGTLQEDPNFVTDSWIRHIDTYASLGGFVMPMNVEVPTTPASLAAPAFALASATPAAASVASPASGAGSASSLVSPVAA